MKNSKLEAALQESKTRLTECMFDLVLLMEKVKQTLTDVAESIECVRDRLGEMEKGE